MSIRANVTTTSKLIISKLKKVDSSRFSGKPHIYFMGFIILNVRIENSEAFLGLDTEDLFLTL